MRFLKLMNSNELLLQIIKDYDLFQNISYYSFEN